MRVNGIGVKRRLALPVSPMSNGTDDERAAHQFAASARIMRVGGKGKGFFAVGGPIQPPTLSPPARARSHSSPNLQLACVRTMLLVRTVSR